MGSVWLAEHLSLRSQVAIKLIHVDMANSVEALTRFLREAQSAAALRSPHVVQILDHGVDEGTPYIAMELLDGESLATRLNRVGSLQWAEVARIMTQIGRAMVRAHDAGIVHRDLKPDNVFLVHNDDEEIAKVLDFGIAKSTGPGSLGSSASSATRTGAVLGTPYYMSPEQVEGAKTLDHRADIWAMGVIAFECLIGRRPFEAETLGGLLLAICTRPIAVPSQCGAVPDGFDAWFARACSRELSERFASARDAAVDLKRICDDRPKPWNERAFTRAAAIPLPLPARAAEPERRAPVLTNQSTAGLSANQLETGAEAKRPGVGAVLTVLAGLMLALGAGLATWSYLKSSSAPAPSASSFIPPTPVAAPPVASSPRVDASPTPTAPTLRAPASGASAVSAVVSAPLAALSGRAASAVRPPAKHAPIAAPGRAAETPSLATGSAKPLPPAVNLGI